MQIRIRFSPPILTRRVFDRYQEAKYKIDWLVLKLNVFGKIGWHATLVNMCGENLPTVYGKLMFKERTSNYQLIACPTSSSEHHVDS